MGKNHRIARRADCCCRIVRAIRCGDALCHAVRTHGLGSAVSRTQYPALFAAIGTTFGVGDGRTTFNLPDLRGEFVRGWDGGRNIDPGRAFGSAQGDAIRNITGSIDTGINSGHQLFDEATATGALAISQRRWKAWTHETTDGRNNPAAFDFDASRVVPTAAENRPRNIALLACIKI